MALTDELETEVKEEEQAEKKDYLDTLVGEGRKYKNPEELAKAYLHANRFIEELKDEKAESTRQSELMNEVLQELRKSTEVIDVPGQEDVTATQVPDDVVKDAVNRALEDKLTEDKAKENVNETMKLLSRFYDGKQRALEVVKGLVEGDESVKETLDRLSLSNPRQAFRFVVGKYPDEEMPTQTNMPGLENAQGVVDSRRTFNGITWTMCQELKKKNPKEYDSIENRKRMEIAVAEAEKAGVNFFST